MLCYKTEDKDLFILNFETVVFLLPKLLTKIRLYWKAKETLL